MRRRSAWVMQLLLVTDCETSGPVSQDRLHETLEFGETCRRGPASEVESQV